MKKVYIWQQQGLLQHQPWQQQSLQQHQPRQLQRLLLVKPCCAWSQSRG